ncbi:hypothetical protein OsJ_30478 [Oryza sativa Japonica Group]|uniref:Uncharacterized protein n=2 Tax=Oryza sativa subsp. japonica TaxID=39947 RepID=B9G5A0_ORYSJ|nr:hypothetical protein OsJ_30478 [Oryza sativa Japonica Group]
MVTLHFPVRPMRDGRATTPPPRAPWPALHGLPAARCRAVAVPHGGAALCPAPASTYLPLSMRGRRWLHIPEGYYGNALAYSITDASASDLCGATLAQMMELVCEARLRVTEEYGRSTVDLMASLRGHDTVFDGVYVVSDLGAGSGWSAAWPSRCWRRSW